MRALGTLGYSLLCLGLAAATTQCSKAANKSSGATFTVLPDKPIVIIGDSVDTQGNAVKGPWFNFRLSMTNNTSDTVTIVSLNVTLYEPDSTGQVTPKIISFSPSDFNYSTTDSSGNTLQCQYYSFGTWTNGQTNPIKMDNGNAACAGYPIFYIGSNTVGPNANSYHYRVVVRPLGWFGTYNVPTDRFDTNFTFYTQ